MRPWPTGLLLTLLSLGIHFAPPLNSQLSMSNERWNPQGHLLSDDYIAYNIEVHRSMEPAFVRRPLMTWGIDLLERCGFSAGWAFTIGGFTLFLLAGVLLRRNAAAMGLGDRDGWSAQVAFHLLPTVLMAYFAPIYTYDEPLQYVFLLLALGAYANKRHAWSVVWFSGAMLARESSVLLFPSLLWYAWNQAVQGGTGSRRSFLARAVVLVLPLLVYATFLLYYLPAAGIVDRSREDLGGRFSFFDCNFGDGDMAGESLCFAFLAVGLPVFLIARYALSTACSADNRRWVKAFLIGLVLNTAVVLVATKAREARLFVLPLMLVLPLLGRAWSVEVERHGGLATLFRPLKTWYYALAFVLFAAIVVLVSDHIFSLSDGVGSENLFHEYFVLSALFMGCCILSDTERTRKAMLRAS